ncbi:conserved hypothetical protein [Candidatus Zixiibacteriota bacterium]|nr:conserved hypothetical protein [candidate division Zixibacteria bacterium]
MGRKEYLEMLKAGFPALAGIPDIKSSVLKFLPRGIIGMKTNCLARKFNSTPPELTEALSDMISISGTSRKNIIIWERTERELEWGGFPVNRADSEIKYLGTDSPGLGYSSDFFNSGPVYSLVSRIITERVDYNINVPVLKDHSVAGLSGGMKNMYGGINNPNKYHDNNCDPFVAHVSNLEPIKKKNRLTAMDAVHLQYNGGPGYNSRFVADYNGIIISDDPVAADRVGLEIIEHFRRINNLPTLEKSGRPVRYLKTAQEIGLGSSDLTKIEIQALLVDSSGKVEKGKYI